MTFAVQPSGALVRYVQQANQDGPERCKNLDFRYCLFLAAANVNLRPRSPEKHQRSDSKDAQPFPSSRPSLIGNRGLAQQPARSEVRQRRMGYRA